MEHIESQSLCDIIKEEKPSLDKIIDLTTQVCVELGKARGVQRAATPYGEVLFRQNANGNIRRYGAISKRKNAELDLTDRNNGVRLSISYYTSMDPRYTH